MTTTILVTVLLTLSCVHAVGATVARDTDEGFRRLFWAILLAVIAVGNIIVTTAGI